MARTPEQVEADEELTRAIEKCLQVYWSEDSFITGDYLVIVTQTRLDANGETDSAYSYLYRDGELPYHRIFGLLEIARQRTAFNMNQEG